MMKHRVASVVACSTVALFVACGDDEKKPTIKIGMINPSTGALAAYGPPLEEAVRLAVAEVNDNGGVLGKKLELLYRDEAGDPAAARRGAEELVEAGVPAIIGGAASSSTLAASEVTIPAQVPLISGASTAPSLTTLADNDFVFRTVIADDAQGVALANLVHGDGHTSANVIYIDNNYGTELANVFETAFVGLGGAVAVKEPYPEDAAQQVGYNWTADLTAAFAGSPPAVVLVAYAEDAVHLLTAWNTGAFNGQWYLTDGCKTETIPTSVGATKVAGIKGTAPASASATGQASFRTAFVDRYGKEPGLFAENYYDAAMLVALALVEAGAATGPAVRDALRAVANPPGRDIIVGEFSFGKQELAAGREINYQGASGPVDLDAAGDVEGAIDVWRFTASGGIETL